MKPQPRYPTLVQSFIRADFSSRDLAFLLLSEILVEVSQGGARIFGSLLQETSTQLRRS